MIENSFRDLNKNGRLDIYEDPSQPIEARVEDLLGQMTLAEKAGLMFQTMVGMDISAWQIPGLPSAPEHIAERQMNHFNVIGSEPASAMADWHNRVQALAEATRLGIPVSISTDPRHAFTDNMAAAMSTTAFSQWPESLGLAATRDAALVQEFGDIARQEYRAIGIHAALHPMADLATEPRWARLSGTFGEDAQLSAEMTAAYIKGFQGETVGPESVACMVKHFPGGGPQKDGEDPHFPYGKEQVYPGDNFDYHLIPFEAAFAVDVAQVMPYYGVPMGIGLEEVAFGFNKQVITGMLRERYGFDGVICTDWGLVTDNDLGGPIFEARAWGVEHLSRIERVKKVLDAGADQFGGEYCPELVIELVESGQIPESRLDAPVRRLLRDKFRLGLFDNPYVDAEAAATLAGNEQFRAAGSLAQRKSIVLLKNSGPVLPLNGRPKLYLEKVNAETAANYGEIVATPEEADFGIIRIAAPFEPRNGNFLESLFHAGDLRFNAEELERIMTVLRAVPTIVDIYLDRPAVIPEINEASAALLVNFGASDAALLEILFGEFNPSGKLPFEMPSSMEAVVAQKPDVPFDSENPLYRFGDGLSY
ncbi:glycoside hydrolase family 3 N-terminal domain-containing protein [soil metagenome]